MRRYRSVSALQRIEIAEVEEGFHGGKVGSSTMAQKRNSGLAMNLIALSRLLRSRVPVPLGDAATTSR